MCNALDVSASGYYSWRKRKNAPPTPRQKSQQQRRDTIEELFNESRKIYGYRKTCAVLRNRGVTCSPNTVHADYKRRGLRSVVTKKHRVCTTDSNHKLAVTENVLDRNFKAERPNEKWVTDITYVETHEGWLFVVAIIDLFSRKVIGYAMADHIKAELVVSALRMALMRGRKIVGEIWLHSDRGVQFSSEMFRDALRVAEIGQSMSRKGNCWDNAPCESWFGKLKSEWIYPHGIYATRKEAKLSIIEYIEMFYNSERVHQALGYRTPNEFETEYFDREMELTAISR
jgi:Transposase and inactivated derivatives